MTARQVVLWRHGETDYNRQNRVQGSIDIDLNEHGRRQAKKAAKALAERYAVGRLVTSDLGRARDTAAALAAVNRTEVLPDARLRERNYGEFEGLAVETVIEAHPGVWDRIVAGTDEGEFGVETKPDLAERGYAALAEHAAQTPDGAALVLTSHGGIISAVIARALGLDVRGFDGLAGLRNARYSVLRPRNGQTDAWRLVEHGTGW